MYQFIIFYTVNSYNITRQLHLTKAGKIILKKKADFSKELKRSFLSFERRISKQKKKI